MTAFYWWDDAVREARARAKLTGRRCRVFALCGYWWVSVQ